MSHFFKELVKLVIASTCDWLLLLFYKNDFWYLRQKCKKSKNRFEEQLYYAYLSRRGAWIGLGAEFASAPILPHGLYGIFISHKAVVGKDVVIYHQVTIGSNTSIGSKRNGSPVIGDNCYIGCGAKIIGNVSIESNVRIGANCIVTKDVPSNSVCVMRGFDIIVKEDPMDNRWINVIAN